MTKEEKLNKSLNALYLAVDPPSIVDYVKENAQEYIDEIKVEYLIVVDLLRQMTALASNPSYLSNNQKWELIETSKEYLKKLK